MRKATQVMKAYLLGDQQIIFIIDLKVMSQFKYHIKMQSKKQPSFFPHPRQPPLSQFKQPIIRPQIIENRPPNYHHFTNTIVVLPQTQHTLHRVRQPPIFIPVKQPPLQSMLKNSKSQKKTVDFYEKRQTQKIMEEDESRKLLKNENKNLIRENTVLLQRNKNLLEMLSKMDSKKHQDDQSTEFQDFSSENSTPRLKRVKSQIIMKRLQIPQKNDEKQYDYHWIKCCQDCFKKVMRKEETWQRKKTAMDIDQRIEQLKQQNKRIKSNLHFL